MKKTAFVWALLAALLLALPALCEGERVPRRPDAGQETVIDPPFDFDPDAMEPRDFGPYFEQSYPTETARYQIAPGTAEENTVTLLRGQADGPLIYVVAGVHGDEMAAWTAGNLLKKAGIKAGALAILSPANPWGAHSTPRSRYVEGQQDLNRSFPGRADGTRAERAAAAIFADIRDKKPAFVLDLHEARTNQEGRDFLGNSLIYTSLDGMDELFMDMILTSQTSEELTKVPFDYFAPGPKGSVNHTVSTALSVPVITVETYRGRELFDRVGDQLAIVQHVLRHYGLV